MTTTASPVPAHNAVSNTAAPTPVSGAVAESDTPLPTPTATAIPRPSATATATSAPTPSPTPTPTVAHVSTSPGDEARVDEIFEDFISISYEASFDMPSELTEGGYPVEATVNGWITMGTTGDGTSQFFMKVAMTKPIERSIEVVSRPNTFSMYLHDLDANKWYFIPENSSEVDIGPVEDISHLWFYGMVFSQLPPDGTQQTPDGYIRKFETSGLRTETVTYNHEYTLETFTMADADGKQFLRARYFDLNKLHVLVPYEQVEELLPDTYWKSQ